MSDRDNLNSQDVYEANPTVPAELRRYLDRFGRVVIWPAKRETRLHVYTYLAAFFEPDRVYSEKGVNQLLSRYLVCNDYATVRRDMCDLRYLQRERDGARYWRLSDTTSERKEERTADKPEVSSRSTTIAERVLAETFGGPIRLGS